jgi:nucleotidyltransferase/DNA polymerase involved in DNA repair
MSTVVPFQRPMAAQRADGVFAAVNIAARRLGYSDALAFRAAREAKQRFLAGTHSAARIVANTNAELRSTAEQVSA